MSTKYTYFELFALVREVRESLGVTQEKLGELWGVSGKSVGHYETGTKAPKEGPQIEKLYMGYAELAKYSSKLPNLCFDEFLELIDDINRGLCPHCGRVLPDGFGDV